MTPVARLFDTTHPRLPDNVVVAIKAVNVTWLMSGMAAGFSGQGVPWLHLPSPGPWWPPLMAAASVVASFGILFSAYTRCWAAFQALVIGVGLLASQGAFAHHRLFVASICLAVASAQVSLLRAQLALVYIAAGADKLTAPDWRDGSVLSALDRALTQFGSLWRPWEHTGEALPLLGRWVSSWALNHGWSSVALGLAVFEISLGIAFAFGSRWTCFGAALFGATVKNVQTYFNASADRRARRAPRRLPRLLGRLARIYCDWRSILVSTRGPCARCGCCGPRQRLSLPVGLETN